MGKRLFCADIEADNLLDDVTKLWCASTTEMSKSMEEADSATVTGLQDIADIFTNPDNILVMHNGHGYDGPAVAKVAGVEVKAEIVDTLFLSWYLYPTKKSHGLAAWGEEFGHPKEQVDDWENLSIDVYKSRCETDVIIQTALWLQIWKHLMLLYGSAEGCWRIIRFLNRKARTAAKQEEARWKLDQPKAVELQSMFSTKYDVAKEALGQNMPKVPEYSKKKYPAKPYKLNRSLSVNGEKWKALVEEHVDPEEYDFGDPLDYKEEIKVIKGYKEPNAGSNTQLKAYLKSIGWVPESFKHIRDKTTGKVRKVEQVKNQDTKELCASVERLIPKNPALVHLRDMTIIKHRLGVVTGFLNNVDDGGYVYAAIQGLTNTLRFKHKICVNLPSSRKPYGEEIRSLLMASSGKTELCGFDMSSLEDRTKQHYMYQYDPEFVLEMRKPGFDPHLDMCLAANLLSEAEVAWFKEVKSRYDDASTEEKEKYHAIDLVRYSGKTTNYASTYGAGAATIALAAGVDVSVGQLLHTAYWERNWSLTAIADACEVKTSRGLKWLWNPVAKLWIYLKAEKDRFSTLNQSTGVYVFDTWIGHIMDERDQLTGQFHDEGITELKKGYRKQMTAILERSIVKVNDTMDLNCAMGYDVGFGDTYAEIH